VLLALLLLAGRLKKRRAESRADLSD
jgi:hypothetical protein